MNLAKYSLDNTKIIYFFLAVLLIGGIFSFGRLGKKEDAPFVIKTAVIMTRYPGAEPAEVEQMCIRDRCIISKTRLVSATSVSVLLPIKPISMAASTAGESLKSVVRVMACLLYTSDSGRHTAEHGVEQ